MGPWLTGPRGDPGFKQHPADLHEAHALAADQKIAALIGLRHGGFMELTISPRGRRPQTANGLTALPRSTDALTSSERPGAALHEQRVEQESSAQKFVPNLVPIPDSGKERLNETRCCN